MDEERDSRMEGEGPEEPASSPPPAGEHLESPSPASSTTACPGPGVIVSRRGPTTLADQVPRWITRFVVEATIAVVFLFVAYWVLGKIKDVVAAVIVALFLSFALEPAVNFLVAHRWNRRAASLFMVLLVIVICLGFIASLVPLLIHQVQELIKEAPHIVRSISRFTDHYFHFQISTAWVTRQLSRASTRLTSFAGSIATNIFGVGLQVVKIFFLILATILFTYYLTADAPRLRRFVLGTMSKERQERVLWTWEVAIDKTGGYLYSRAILAALSTVLMFVMLLILGVPYPLPLALWQGVVSQFLPTFGTYIGGVVPLLVTLTISPWSALALLIYLILYQLFENHVVAPPLTARTMHMHAGLAFGAAFAGAYVYGVIGALLALPLAAIGQAAMIAYGQRFEVLEADLTRDNPVLPEAGARSTASVLGKFWGAIKTAVLWVGRVTHLWRPKGPDERKGPDG